MFLLAILGAITYTFGRLLEVRGSDADREANKLCIIMQIVGGAIFVVGFIGMILIRIF